MAAGPYYAVRDEHDGIPLGIFCRQSLAAYLDPDEIFEVTRQGFDYFHDAFGVRYPFGKYDQLFVPEFKAGAMENAGCVTFLEAYVFRSRVTDTYRESRAETILHEMAHMWFGDLVTMRWWDDLWLNESFATWAGTVAQAEATRWTGAWTTFAQAWKAWAYRQDQLPSTHPIAADIPDIEAVEVNFDGITYAKGAAVLKQLVAHVGRENFLAGVRRYFAQHAWGNATLGDLLAALEEASGRDLADWSKKWLETAGVNTLRPEYRCDAEGRFTAFAVLQEAPASHPVLRPHRIAIGLYDRGEGGLARRHRVEIDIDGERTEVPGAGRAAASRPGAGQRRRPDLRQDPAGRPFAAHADQRHRRVHRVAPGRAVLGRRVGHVPGRGDGRARLREPGPVRRGRDRGHHGPADRAAPGRDGGAPVRRPGLAGLRAGADRRRRCATCCGTPSLARIASSPTPRRSPGWPPPPATWPCWPGCSTVPPRSPGLAVDTELRWQLLYRLVSRGAAGPAEIDAELARDATDAGARHAAACRAAIPDPAAKEEAWAQITGGTLPNATFRATLDGFTDPDADELLEPYAEPLLRRRGRHLAGLELGHGPVLHRVRLPVVEDHARGHRAHRRLHRADQPARRRCAGCSPRAATTWPARCAAASATPRRPALDHRLRATPPHRFDGLLASISERGRHSGTRTTPGSTRSSPSNSAATSARDRNVAGSAAWAL